MQCITQVVRNLCATDGTRAAIPKVNIPRVYYRYGVPIASQQAQPYKTPTLNPFTHTSIFLIDQSFLSLRKTSGIIKKTSKEQMVRQPLTYHTMQSQQHEQMSFMAKVFRWLQRKRYQYEVTFSLYMLTPTEKFIFSKILSLAPTLAFETIKYRQLTFFRLIYLPLLLHDPHRCVSLPPSTHQFPHFSRMVLLPRPRYRTYEFPRPGRSVRGNCADGRRDCKGGSRHKGIIMWVEIMSDGHTAHCR